MVERRRHGTGNIRPTIRREIAEEVHTYIVCYLILQVNTEMATLESRMKADLARKDPNMSVTKQISSTICTILDPSIFKPLVIINVFTILQQISGTYVVVSYAVDLITDIGENFFITLANTEDISGANAKIPSQGCTCAVDP